MKTKFIKLALTAIFGFAIAFIISCIPPTIVVYPANSYSSIAVDNSSSSETVPSSSSYSVEPSSSSSAEPSSSSVAPSSSSILPSSSSVLPSSSSVATYTIKYDANGGTGASADQKKIHNAPLTLSGATSAKPGYTFASWNTAANGSGVSYAHGASYVTNASVTLYAQWKANTYTVKYDANGGIGVPADQKKIHNAPLTLSGAIPTRQCHTFVSWSTAANGSGTSYAHGANYTDNANVTLYAQWKVNTYTVKYDANGGTGAPADQEKTCGVALTLSSVVPTRADGFAFASWNTLANGKGMSYAPEANYADNASVTLYAQWICKTDNGPSVSYSGETYNSIVICGQTWMARNLNYAVDGSKCPPNISGGCAVYGRLYNWATAMALPPSCNSNSCASQVSAKHKGICLPGWHIPSKDEWSTLVSNVESSKGCANCAGKHLKAASGWENCSASGSPSPTGMKSESCLDSYGFSALPGGGIAGAAINFIGKTVGEDGAWWIATEYSDSKRAYLRYAHNSYEYLKEGLGGDGDNKVNFFSVRCVKD